MDGQIERDPACKIDPARQEITLAGECVEDRSFQYYILHKPAGILTAARDAHATTVMALLPEALSRRKVLPVGRLDKDTTGVLLLTNDGELAHRLLSPKRHVTKEYHAWVAGELTSTDVTAFAEGIALSDFTAKPAQMRIISSSATQSQATLWLCEGKFHQVRRMFASRGHEVLALHRAAFGSLPLGDLPEGKYRELTSPEVALLREAAQKISTTQQPPTSL